MFNPDIQYRCTIIRGKAQNELDDFLSAYANIIADVCPCIKTTFDNEFNNCLSQLIYKEDFCDINHSHQKTIRNHITEIAGKLFGLYVYDGEHVYESQSNKKLLLDNDQPAFFKNLCLNFQFPNGTQKIQTIVERIQDSINFKPFHFILNLLSDAKKKNITLTKNEVGYYVLNAKQVLQGKIKTSEVLKTILIARKNNITKRLAGGSYHTQHINEQLNLLVLANLVVMKGNNLIINEAEARLINEFIAKLNQPLKFNIFRYNLNNNVDKKKLYYDWSAYFGKIAVTDPDALSTNINALHTQYKDTKPQFQTLKKENNRKIIGDEGEEFVFNLEKNRVNVTHPKLINKILFLGNQKGFGYDICSVEAGENKQDPEFARFIEVKSTKRITEPNFNDNTWIDTINLTRKEWIAAKQYRTAYNIYRVYFTPHKVIVIKINDPFGKKEQGILNVTPTLYRVDFNYKSIDIRY